MIKRQYVNYKLDLDQWPAGSYWDGVRSGEPLHPSPTVTGWNIMCFDSRFAHAGQNQRCR